MLGPDAVLQFCLGAAFSLNSTDEILEEISCIVHRCLHSLIIDFIDRAYLSKAHDGEGLANQRDSSVLRSLPLATLDRSICLSHISAEGADEGNAMLCCCHCVGSGCIDNQAAILQGTPNTCQWPGWKNMTMMLSWKCITVKEYA